MRQTIQVNPSIGLFFALAENLITQDKIDGKDQAADYISRLRQAGLGDTVVRYLEAKIVVQQKNWAEAIRRIEMARPVLRADRRLTAQLDLMLVECFGRVGDQERRLEALQRLAESDRASDFTRIEFAKSLVQAGKLDRGIAILMPLSVEKPELKLEVVHLLIQKTSRQPRDQRNWEKVEGPLRDAEKALPQAAEPLLLLRVDLLAEQDRIADALSLLESAHAKDPVTCDIGLVWQG